MPRNTTEENPTAGEPRTNRLVPAAILLITGVAAVGGFGTLFSIWARSTAPGVAETLRIASDQYAAGRPEIAARLAESVEVSPEENPEQFRVREFLIGAGLAGQAAADIDGRQRRRLLAAAVPHLEAAASDGFPPGRDAQGHRLLGQALVEVGRLKDAAEHLEQVVRIDPTSAKEILPRLAEAQVRAPELAPAVALQTVDTYLANPNLTALQRAAGGLLRGRVLSRMQRWTEARAALRQVGQSVEDPALRQQAELWEAVSQVNEAQTLVSRDPEAAPPLQAVALLDDALQTLERLDRQADPALAAQARLWAARASRTAGDDEKALEWASSVRQMRPFGAEAIAGGLEEIELLAAREGKAADALQTVRYLIREIADPHAFDPRLVTLAEFRSRVVAVAEQLRRAGEFEAAIDIARVLPPIFSTDDALALEADIFVDWARHTEQAEPQSPADGAPLPAAAAARERYRWAGEAYAAAADIRFERPQYVPTLWQAIDAFQQGHAFHRSLALLDDYLRYEDRARRARGLIAQGRALLAIGQPAPSLEPLTEVIEQFPRDALRYEAHLIAATAHAELGQLKQARQLLEANLIDGQLAPSSPVWRDSLFVLGELLYRDGYDTYLTLAIQGDPGQPDQPVGSGDAFRSNQQILEQAIQRLEESVQRYWPTPRARHAAYLAARAHQLAAYWPAVEGAMPETLEAARRQLKQQRDTHLAAARDAFASLRERLADDDSHDRLSDSDQAMLRNCYIAEADMLREMERFAEAAEAYKQTSLRYLNEPLALEAMVGQARCLEALGQRRQSQLLVRQAENVLQRIPAQWDQQFADTTRYSRAQWQQLLAWLQRAPAEPDS